MTAVSALERIRTALIGTTPWKVEQGHGSFLTLDFGAKISSSLRDGTPHQRGEWHFWVQHCGWDVFGIEGELLAHEESSREEIKDALALLKASPLEKLEYEAESGDISLSFENGAMLALYAPEEEEGECLDIFTPDGNTLSFGPGNALDYGSAKLPRK